MSTTTPSLKRSAESGNMPTSQNSKKARTEPNSSANKGSQPQRKDEVSSLTIADIEDLLEGAKKRFAQAEQQHADY